jgi:hypothetical protein
MDATDLAQFLHRRFVLLELTVLRVLPARVRFEPHTRSLVKMQSCVELYQRYSTHTYHSVAVDCGSRYLSRYSDSLRAGRSCDLIPVGGEIFRTSTDRPTGPPSLLYDEYRLFPGGYSGRDVELTTYPSSAEVKEREELYFHSPSGISWPVLG